MLAFFNDNNGKITLPLRLLAVAQMVPPGSRVADIGTDHAYLPVYLVASGRCPHVVAVEKKWGPYRRALATVAGAGLQGRVEVRLGDGLAPLKPGEVDTVTITGLGALTQQEILTAGAAIRHTLRRLILQPQGEAGPLRRFLATIGWCLEEEELVYEGGHYYFIMAAAQGESPAYSEIEWRYGPLLLRRRHPLLRVYLLQSMEKLNAARRQLLNAKSERSRCRLVEVDRQLEDIREVLAWLQDSAK